MSEVTLARLIERASASQRGVRFIDRREKETFFSYREIHHRASQTAGGLKELGVRPGDRVAIILPTCIEFFDAFFGAVLCGAVPVALYPPLRLGRLDEYHQRTSAMLEKSGARLVLTQRTIGRLLDRTRKRVDVELGFLAMGDLPRKEPVPVASLPDDLALIQFSSGTTSEPKPIRLTHRQILANVDAIREAILKPYPEGPELKHTAVSWLPLYHDMGLVGSVFTSMAHPSDLILIPPELFVSRPAIWLRTISRYHGTVSPAPNFAYSLCAERISDDELEGVDLSSWCLALNGAEPVTPIALRRFLERFRRYGLRKESLTPVYGLAEATLALTFSDPARAVQAHTFDRAALAGDGTARIATDGPELASVGTPLAGYEIRIADEDGEELEAGRVGRLLARGPSITSEGLRDGWLDTGDQGFVCEGELYLYGRNKDLIVLRGRNYAPQDIEHALDGLAHLRSGCLAAIGVVHENGSREELVVLAERSRDANPSADSVALKEVRQRILDRTGLLTDEVRIMEPGTLPRTSNGKIRRNEARRQYLLGTLRPPKRFAPWRIAGEMILSLASRGKRAN